MADRHRPKLIIDNHLSLETIGGVFTGRRVFNRATLRRYSTYNGSFSDDEDFTEILQLAWENQVPLISADAKMIEKALAFNKEKQRGTGREDCLRGVIVVPHLDVEQVPVLRRFEAGELPVVTQQKGVDPPASIEDVYSLNCGIDLRKAHPRAIDLCTCPIE